MSQPHWMKDAPAWVQEGRQPNEAEWLAGPHLIWMVSFLLHTRLDRPGEDRRHLLFGCACCRIVWDLLQLDGARHVVEMAERYADGEVSGTEFRAASAPANFVGLDLHYRGEAAPGTQLSARALHAIGGARWLAAENFRKSHGAYGVAQETCKDRTKDYVPTPEHPCGGKFAAAPDDAKLAERIATFLATRTAPGRSAAPLR